MTAQPAALLTHAQNLLDDGLTAGPHRARLAAIVGRQALEQIVIDRCSALKFDAEWASMRSRLIFLRVNDDRDVATAVTYAWGQLSAACHHHAYELSPSTEEVRKLCLTVLDVLIGRGST